MKSKKEKNKKIRNGRAIATPKCDSGKETEKKPGKDTEHPANGVASAADLLRNIGLSVCCGEGLMSDDI